MAREATFTKTVSGVSLSQLWNLMIDVDRWHLWDQELEYAKLEGPFAEGSYFKLRPKGGPQVRILIHKVTPRQCFVDRTNFPLATMYGTHEFKEVAGGVSLTITIKVEGLLSFLWWHLVGSGIAKGAEAQIDAMARYAMKAA